MKLILALTFVAVGASVFMTFGYAPEHRVQGDLQRIFYAHVSTASVCYIAFIIVAVAGGMYLARRDAKWDRVARAATGAPVRQENKTWFPPRDSNPRPQD